MDTFVPACMYVCSEEINTSALKQPTYVSVFGCFLISKRQGRLDHAIINIIVLYASDSLCLVQI